MTYCLTVTNKCNWNCSYCISETHTNDRQFEEALELAKNIPENSDVSISGGEPGLLKTSQIILIIDILNQKNCKITIKSNGQIYKHHEVLSRINKVIYHCSENLNIEDEIIKDYKDITDFIVVITDNNISKLNNFLKKHDDINIRLVPAFHKEPLSKSNIINLYKNFKNRLNNEELKDLFKTPNEVIKI